MKIEQGYAGAVKAVNENPDLSIELMMRVGWTKDDSRLQKIAGASIIQSLQNMTENQRGQYFMQLVLQSLCKDNFTS